MSERTEIFKVVDADTGEEISGYNNAVGFYNTLTGAKGIITRQKRLDERYNSYHSGNRVREFKILKSQLSWVDVETNEGN